MKSNTNFLANGGGAIGAISQCFDSDPTLCPGMMATLQSPGYLVAITAAQLNTLFSDFEYSYQLDCYYKVTLYPIGSGFYNYTDPDATESGLSDFEYGKVKISSTGVLSGRFFFDDNGAEDEVAFKYESEDEGEEFLGEATFHDGSGASLCPGRENKLLEGTPNPYFVMFYDPPPVNSEL